MAGNNFKVRLVSVWNPGTFVMFNVTPTFTESGSVSYDAVTPIHLPGSIQIYKSTNARTFSIVYKMISRTLNEASNNVYDLQLLRSWRYPFFGKNSSTLTDDSGRTRSQFNTLQKKLGNTPDTGTAFKNVSANGAINSERANFQNQLNATTFNQGVEMLGAPPEVLYLYAYSTSANDDRQNGIVNINRVPVVLTSLSISYPEDVDYLVSASGEPFPIRLEVSVECAETHSPTEFSNFSLQQYKLGQLVNW